MSLYEKIGRLIKQNKLYEIYNPNLSNDSNFESLISDLLLVNKIESKGESIQNIINNNKLFTKSDFEEAQNLIKNCTPDGQLILIAILEIQLSLMGKENNYIKYEKKNEKIIEKNIYWVITKEIHKRVHKEKKDNEFDEYCHCIHDQKEKYILGAEYNFKYENIDSIICKLAFTNKNIEFIAIKTIFITFYNIACEYTQKYMEIDEYNKKNNYCEYTIFEYIINDYKYINENLKFIDFDFKQSLNIFKRNYNINFSFLDLFKDIFFNVIFHNQILGCQYIHGFICHDSNVKNSLLEILNIISSQCIPLYKNISKILKIENLFSISIDLTSKIIEKSEQLHICVGIKAIEKECKFKDEDEKNNEYISKKEIIYVNGCFDKNENKKFNLISNLSKINMEKIFFDIEKNDIESTPVFKEKEFNEDNKKEKEKSPNKKEKEKAYEKESNAFNKDCKNKNKEENPKANNNKNNLDKKSLDNNENINMENKSLDEVYEYISKGNKIKSKKKNKRRNGKNKGKSKKNQKNNNEEYIGEDIYNDIQDPIVIQFKNDISEKVVYANTITKIKPFFSENWLKTISSY